VGNPADIIISFAGNIALARDLFKHLSSCQIIPNNDITESPEDEIRVSLRGNNADDTNRVKRVIEEIIH
jgi:hypothetical protein